MTATPPGDGSKELADMPHLSDVQATDALLDRLGARTPTEDDLADPLVAELAALAEFADASPVPPVGIDRLMEVLDGRPLYMFDRGVAAVAEEDEPIDLDLPLEPARPAARMIDLTGASRAGSAAGADRPDADDELAGVAARVADDDARESDRAAVASLTLFRSMRLARRPITKSGWQGAVQQLALPAASVVALLALGGGVSAVVTGDPMAPVYGVSKVVSALPGIDDDAKDVKEVQDNIKVAASAVTVNPQAASKSLTLAQDGLDDVPDASKPSLQAQINDVLEDLASTPSPSASAPVPSVSATASPSTTPTPSATTPPPSIEPTVEPTVEPSVTATSSPAADTDPVIPTTGGSIVP